MRLAILKDAAGIRPWLEAKNTGNVFIVVPPEKWPSWIAGGMFTGGNLRTPRRHGGAFAWANPGVDTTVTQPLSVLSGEPTVGWTAPPAPSASDAAVLFEGAASYAILQIVDFETTEDWESLSGYEDVTATPDASLAYRLANPTVLASHVTLPQPRWMWPAEQSSQYIANYLPLIKGGDGADQRQSAQGAYVVERFGGSMPEENSTFTWDGTDWTEVDAPYEYLPVPIDGSWLYTVTVTPETGVISSITPLRECRYVLAEGFTGLRSTAITWPGSTNIRKFHGYTRPDVEPPGSSLYRVRVIWRAAGAPVYNHYPLNEWEVSGTVNSTNGVVPHPWYSGSIIRQVSWGAEQSAIEDTFLGTPTGGWNILADGSPNADTVNGAWSAMTINTEPAEGTEIIMIVGTMKPGSDYDPQAWRSYGAIEIWPEAAVLPYPVSLAGGGLLPGGTG